MKQFRKSILTLASLFVLASMLTSCGGESLESIDPLNPGTKVIQVWVHKNETEDEGKIYKQIQTNFNNAGIKSPNGQTLKMSMTFWGTTLESKIDASLLTGGLPDIVAVDSSDVAAKVYNNVIVPFGEHITEEVKDSYVDSVIGQGTIDDKLYFLSAMEAPGGLYYNKKMLREVGYTDEQFGNLDSPWSFKDVHDAQKVLKAAGKPYQIALNVGFGTDGHMYLYSPLVYTAGATFGTENNVAAALTTPQAVAGIAQLERFYLKEGLTSNESWVYSGTSDSAFASEQVPFQIHGPWDARRIAKADSNLKNEYGIMPFPVYENKSGVKSNILASPNGSFGFGITKDSRDVGAAAVALTYLTGEVASEMMFNAIGTFPTHKSLLNEMDVFKSGPEKELADFLKVNTFTRPKMVKYPMLKDAYGEVLDYIKNINTLGASYDLAKHIQDQMSRVDRAAM
jgi:fructooligosaccharide transport system substrate-binding protein